MKYFLILILLLAFLNAYNQPARIDYSQPPEWEMEYYTRLFTKTHGIEGCVYEEGCWFKRNGKWCKL
jgi:hypothetical protein